MGATEKLTVFGIPEERAVEQIENVLRDERAVKGAQIGRASCRERV